MSSDSMFKKETRTNAELGEEIHKHLLELGIETPIVQKRNDTPTQYQHICDSFGNIMRTMGLAMEDDSLRDTPRRVAKMYCEEVFYGLDYTNFPKCTTVENKMRYEEMVSSRATVKSMCEHHFVPFIGVAHVAYLPNHKVIGLSKVNRIVDFFCRRPQIQERLTEQVSAALRYILDTEDVAVVIQAKHFCVHLRGVQDNISETTTSKVTGKFRSEAPLRAEFLALTRGV